MQNSNAWETWSVDRSAEAVPQELEWIHEIRMDQRERVAALIAPGLDNKYRTAIITGVFLIGLGVVGWIAGSSSGLVHSPVSSPAQQVTSVRQVSPSASPPAAGKSGALEGSGFPNNPVTKAPAAVRADETSIIRAKAAPPVLATKQDARPPGLTAVERTKVAARPVPVPETRPTTIEGWTVRDVNNGTVTLQGPNGVWKATRGSTVPGVGNITSIVRWGDRWIVATSKGLISTP